MAGLIELREDSSGSVVVEFTLFLPVFLILIFGLVNLGSAWYAKQVLINASREGARLGVLYSDGGTTNAAVAAEVAQFLNDSGYPNDFLVEVTGADGFSGTPVTVRITSEHDLAVLGELVPGLPDTVTLSAVTVMRHE